MARADSARDTSFSETLEEIGITLTLPVSELTDKSAAIDELRTRGLVTDALEQKCLLQFHHRDQSASELERKIDIWQSALVRTIADPPEIRILDIRHYP